MIVDATSGGRLRGLLRAGWVNKLAERASLLAGDVVVTGSSADDEAADAGEGGGEPVPGGREELRDSLTGGEEHAANGGFP